LWTAGLLAASFAAASAHAATHGVHKGHSLALDAELDARTPSFAQRGAPGRRARAPPAGRIAWPSPEIIGLLKVTPRPHHAVIMGALAGVGSAPPREAALAVAYHGQARVVELETVDSQAIVRTGLELLEQQSRERYGREFLGLAETEQTDLVREVSRTPPESPLGRCYLFLRREAIRGYFTSQAGLMELDYKGNAFYGACPGCESRRG